MSHQRKIIVHQARAHRTLCIRSNLPSENWIQIVENFVFFVVDFVVSTSYYKIRVRQTVEIHGM